MVDLVGKRNQDNQHCVANQAIGLGAAHYFGIVAPAAERHQGIVHKGFYCTR